MNTSYNFHRAVRIADQALTKAEEALFWSKTWETRIWLVFLVIGGSGFLWVMWQFWMALRDLRQFMGV